MSASKQSDWHHSAYLVTLTQFDKCMFGFPRLDPSSSATEEALDVQLGLELTSFGGKRVCDAKASRPWSYALTRDWLGIWIFWATSAWQLNI